MRTSRTFRPAADGLETRNLLSGGAVAPNIGDNAYLLYVEGKLEGHWSSTSALNPNAVQYQTLVGDFPAQFAAKTDHGFERKGGLVMKLNSSTLAIVPIRTGIKATGALNLTVTERQAGNPVSANVTLKVFGDAATGSSQEIRAKLTFPTTSRGGFEELAGENIYITEKVNPDKESGTFAMEFSRRDIQDFI